MPLARPDYESMRRETSVFTEIVAMLDGDGAPAELDRRLARPAFVTGNFFQAMGVQAALGRSLLPEDDERFQGRPVIVLSHAGWQKLFRGDRDVIGRRVTIGGAPYEIVGVMPDGFRGLGVTPPDYWLPLALAGQSQGVSTERNEGIEVIGRLKPGLSPEAATAAFRHGHRDGPTSRRRRRVRSRFRCHRARVRCRARGSASSSSPCSSPSG